MEGHRASHWAGGLSDMAADITTSSNAFLGTTFVHWSFPVSVTLSTLQILTKNAGNEWTDHYSVLTELTITRLPAAKPSKRRGLWEEIDWLASLAKKQKQKPESIPAVLGNELHSLWFAFLTSISQGFIRIKWYRRCYIWANSLPWFLINSNFLFVFSRTT